MSTLLGDLLAELAAARVPLGKQIRGIISLNNDAFSDELHSELSGELVDRQRRDALLANAIAALEALEADGYPETPPETLPGKLFQELSGDVSDIEAGAAVFVAAPLATTIGVNLQPFVDKE
jgi:hypothetical protein